MKKFLPLLLLPLLLTACHPEQMAMNDLQKFTERIEMKSDGWSDADWDDALMHYSEICQTIERYDYTDEQRHQIGELKGRCMAKFYKHSFDDATQGMHDSFIELGGAIEGLLDGLGK